MRCNVMQRIGSWSQHQKGVNITRSKAKQRKDNTHGRNLLPLRKHPHHQRIDKTILLRQRQDHNFEYCQYRQDPTKDKTKDTTHTSAHTQMHTNAPSRSKKRSRIHSKTTMKKTTMTMMKTIATQYCHKEGRSSWDSHSVVLICTV